MRTSAFRNIIWWVIAGVCVFAPLARGGMRDWAVTVIEVVIFLTLFFWLWRLNNHAKRGQARLRGITKKDFIATKLDMPICLFVLLAIVSCIFSIYKYASIQSTMRLLAIVGVYYVVLNNFNEERGIRFAFLIVIVGTCMSALGLGQYFLGLSHSWWNPQNFIAATYVNHNHFSGYLEMALPLAIGMFVCRDLNGISQKKQILIKFLLILAIFIMFLSFVFSQSRGGWVCLTVALVVMNIVLVRKKVLRKESLIIFLFFVALAGAYILGGDDAVARRFRTFQNIDDVAFVDGRVGMWTGSVKAIKDRPLTGSGIGTFVWRFSRYRPETLRGTAHYAHNDYLHMMVEEGVLALPLMLWFLYTAIKTGLNGKPKDRYNKSGRKLETIDIVRISCGIGILSLALHGLVDFNFHIFANMLTVACLAGIVMRKEHDNA